jgi:DNA-directed RNA polymerase subunit RPC12/RpoP
MARSALTLARTHPNLAAEALFDPTTVTPGSSRKLPWRCVEGHEWLAQVKNRTSRGSGCPVCGNKRVMPGVNDLATTHPHLATEAVFDPTTITFGVGRKMPWRCSLGHEWSATVASRAKGAGCPYCAGKRILPGVSDLASTHPHLVAEALFDATTVAPSHRRKLPWRCAQGHEWQMTPAHRTGKSPQGCPVCANRTIVPGVNDLATTHPHLSAQALFDPSTVTFGSSRPLPWRCSLGHEWTAPVAGRASSGEGCPVCAGKVVVPGYNDLATLHPGLAAEALEDPAKLMAGSNKKVRWRCADGHEWVAMVKSRTGPQRHGCPVCSHKRVAPGVNDLATTHPEVAAEALFDPTTVTSGSAKSLPWRCAVGHEWRTAPQHRAHRGSGCPYCGNKRVLAGDNDLATLRPDIAADALFDATTVLVGSHRKVPWRCTEGHEWVATVKSRTDNGTGCPSCAATGYDPGKDGWLYLMEHPRWGLLQIGITNDFEARTRVHRRRGWEVLDVRGPMTGYAARAWEVAILQFLADRSVQLTTSSSATAPSRAGVSQLGVMGEAWWEADYSVKGLAVLMEAVREQEWA